MTLKTYLQRESQYFGVHAPDIIWLAALGLLLFTLLVALRLLWVVRRERRIHRAVREQLTAIHQDTDVRPGSGLPAPAYERMMQAFEQQPTLKHAANIYKGHLLLTRSPEGQDQFWAADSGAEAFSGDTVLESRINRSFYTAFPGLVTGIGLLVTFFAILVALLDVRIEENQVKGLELLISGLSGKFLSSVTALLLASIFLPLERRQLYNLECSRLALVEAIDQLVPRRTAVHELHDVRKQIEEQAISFRRLNTEVFPETIKKSMSESMGPTLDRMVASLEDLNRLMRAAEAAKQESISGSLEGVLRELQASLTETLGEMGKEFRNSISGDAMRHFEEVGRSLSGTARLLEAMKAQFEGNQANLARLTREAEEQTERQMALGRSQVEELNEVLRRLMAQLQESTGSSVTQMNAALAMVVGELSDKVNQLGDKMAATVEQSAGRATQAAEMVVGQAQTLSERNATQLAAILEKHAAQLDRTEELRRLLETTLVSMREGMQSYGTASGELLKASQQTTALVSQFDGVAGRMAATHESIARTAQSLQAQSDGMQRATAQQEQLWQHIDQTMAQYETTFARVERQAEQLLTQIDAHVRGYTESTRKGYEQLRQVADEHFSNAVQKLGGAVGELDDVLSELAETLGKAGRSGR